MARYVIDFLELLEYMERVIIGIPGKLVGMDEWNLHIS